MNDTSAPFFSVSNPSTASSIAAELLSSGYDHTASSAPRPDMANAADRDPVAFVADVTSALSPMDAYRLLEGTLSAMVRQLEERNESPPKNCPVGVDCGILVLTPKLLQKMVVILRRYQCTLAMVYARLPQTQQAALGMGLLVKEAPEPTATFDVQQWMDFRPAPSDEEPADNAPALNEAMPTHYTDVGEHPTRAPEWQSATTTMTDTPQRPSSLSDRILAPSIPLPIELDAPTTKTVDIDSYQALPTEWVGDGEESHVLPMASAVAATPGVASTTAAVESAPERRASTPMETTFQPADITQALVAAHTLPTRLVQGSLRSGQTIASDGHLIVLGDVHGGSEIVAAGHIIVWGELRGVAHAGALVKPTVALLDSAQDNTETIPTLGETGTIRALAIHAVQLRVGRYIARRPDRVDNHKPERPLDAATPISPEIARVVDGEIRIYEALA